MFGKCLFFSYASEYFSFQFHRSRCDYSSECYVLWSRSVDAESLVDTKHSLFRSIWSLEIDTARGDERRQSTRVGYRRYRYERRVLVVEKI